jgi:hypothetical protein
MLVRRQSAGFFREQLRVDLKWSVKLPTGFTWWADRHAQTIEIVGSEASETAKLRI